MNYLNEITATPKEMIIPRNIGDGIYRWWLYVDGVQVCTLADGELLMWSGELCRFEVARGVNAGWSVTPVLGNLQQNQNTREVSEGMILVRVKWKNPDRDWPWFYLISVNGEKIHLKGADYPDGSAMHEGDSFWASVREIDKIVYDGQK